MPIDLTCFEKDLDDSKCPYCLRKLVNNACARCGYSNGVCGHINAVWVNRRSVRYCPDCCEDITEDPVGSEGSQ